LALSQVVPEHPRGVPVSKIVKIRKRYAAEFDAFYVEVAGLARQLEGELSGIADQKIMAHYLENEVARRFRNPLKSLERAMKSEGIDTSITALTTKIALPASMTAVGAEALTHNPVVAVSGAVAFGTISLIRDLQRNRSNVAPSAASYLWRVDRALNPGSVLRSMNRK
jgi:hypothetical protein